jgi:hypothetical protein
LWGAYSLSPQVFFSGLRVGFTHPSVEGGPESTFRVFSFEKIDSEFGVLLALAPATVDCRLVHLAPPSLSVGDHFFLLALMVYQGAQRAVAGQYQERPEPYSTNQQAGC